MTGTAFRVGDYAPWFEASVLDGAPRYQFHVVGGRHVLLLFLGSTKLPPAAGALAVVARHRSLFDDQRACFFGISVDRTDAATGRIRTDLPGIRYVLDDDRAVSTLFGAVEGTGYRPHWLLLDPHLRIVGRYPVADGEAALADLAKRLAAPPPDVGAPVIVVPDILEPRFCSDLIAGYLANGGEASGFMREVDGKTVRVSDPRVKQRSDWQIEDEALRGLLADRLVRRLAPAIERAFQFQPTRIERYLVACYDESGGYFRPHRDNTTRGTAHRKFAVTINLNAEEYDGGELRFPEFGRRSYRAPTGGAVVFSCSLLHEALPVTRGRRYAFLPFLYDEEGARLRSQNNAHLGENVRPYMAQGTAPPSTLPSN